MSETCRECGASVSEPSKHRNWHYELDRKLKEALDEAKRAKREARR